MARYIDADELHKIIENGVGTPALKLFADCCVELAPTADVAPKSEVDWNSIPVDVSEALKQRAVEKAKSEVAREIFEEIYKTMNDLYSRVQHSMVGMHGDSPETMRLLGKLDGIVYLGDEIAELKKKYVESENG